MRVAIVFYGQPRDINEGFKNINDFMLKIQTFHLMFFIIHGILTILILSLTHQNGEIFLKKH